MVLRLEHLCSVLKLARLAISLQGARSNRANIRLFPSAHLSPTFIEDTLV